VNGAEIACKSALSVGLIDQRDTFLVVTCLEECPSGTVKNEDNEFGRCIGCIDGCDVCEESNPNRCLECKPGLLLQPDIYEDGRISCQGTCPPRTNVNGRWVEFMENFRGTRCIEVDDSAVWVYFPCCIFAALCGIISIGGKYSSKNVSGQHRRLLSFYSFVALFDVAAIWFQIIVTFVYG
jgi:hypothetical protein